jgi:hypothetical protein
VLTYLLHIAVQTATPAEIDRVTSTFEELIDLMRASNPVVQRYKTMVERNFGTDVPEAAVPLVPGGALSDTIAATQVCMLSRRELHADWWRSCLDVCLCHDYIAYLITYILLHLPS